MRSVLILRAHLSLESPDQREGFPHSSGDVRAAPASPLNLLRPHHTRVTTFYEALHYPDIEVATDPRQFLAHSRCISERNPLGGCESPRKGLSRKMCWKWRSGNRITPNGAEASRAPRGRRMDRTHLTFLLGGGFGQQGEGHSTYGLQGLGLLWASVDADAWSFARQAQGTCRSRPRPAARPSPVRAAAASGADRRAIAPNREAAHADHGGHALVRGRARTPGEHPRGRAAGGRSDSGGDG